MVAYKELESYLGCLASVLGHMDRRSDLVDYCQGLMLPIKRKSVEPLAAHMDPAHVQAKHRSLHHFVAQSPWSDALVLREVRAIVEPVLGLEGGCYWIVDDTGSPKQGHHSVGVARQYCGQLGKTDNCQVAVSLSLASESGSLPIKWQLYLPKEWTDDPQHCKAVGVPEEIGFATKPEIALEQMRQALGEGVPPGVVLAYPAYGDETAFRDGITELGLPYMMEIRSTTTVWAPGVEPLPPKPWSGRGRRPKLLRRAPGHQPISAKALAAQLPKRTYRTISWREGTNEVLRSRFAAVRVHPAHQDYWRDARRPEEWLLIEWPQGDAAPLKYWLSTGPTDAALDQLVFVAKMRWRIERDYRDVKQEFGLAHYEGRTWRGVHHHATLCIAGYAFLLHQRLTPGGKKTAARPKAPPLPEGYIPRGSRQSSAPRRGFDSDAALPHRPDRRQQAAAMPVLRSR